MTVETVLIEALAGLVLVLIAAVRQAIVLSMRRESPSEPEFRPPVPPMGRGAGEPAEAAVAAQ